ncbi:MAG: helix-turn-helix domain-containing protein [Clostridia bacterium]|nr:helix-turn-helix domain-containing protein [Clostridia bacterium]
MGKQSVREEKNIYQITREKLGYSRAQAAELMEYLPDYRLVKIEDGSVSVQPEDVIAMSRAYCSPELRNHYCTHECPIGKVDVPEITFNGNIYEILVNMVVSLDSINNKKGRLMEILSDGKVDEHERADFDQIQAELEHISMTIEAIQLWCEKMKLLMKEQKDKKQ